MGKYNYVIFQTAADYYSVSYSDLKNREDVIYINQFFSSNSVLLKTIYRFHHSKKINSFIKLPAKNIWYPSYFNETFKTKCPICFIFNARWMQYDYMQDFVHYLKNKYIDAKYVCFYQDLVKSHPGADPDILSEFFDLILSYDKGDVEKYGLIYHPTVFSRYAVEQDLSIPESDIYFVGLAKDRFNSIFEIYYKLREAGFICDFYLSGVPPLNQIKEEGIHYIDKMGYMDNLKHVVRTKCLLEIIQNGAKGSTVRTWEAIMYDKKLLTNNVSIVDDFYYNAEYISLINNNNINVEFLDKINTYENPYKEKISPNELLKFIASKL